MTTSFSTLFSLIFLSVKVVCKLIHCHFIYILWLLKYTLIAIFQTEVLVLILEKTSLSTALVLNTSTSFKKVFLKQYFHSRCSDWWHKSPRRITISTALKCNIESGCDLSCLSNVLAVIQIPFFKFLKHLKIYFPLTYIHYEDAFKTSIQDTNLNHNIYNFGDPQQYK